MDPASEDVCWPGWEAYSALRLALLAMTSVSTPTAISSADRRRGNFDGVTGNWYGLDVGDEFYGNVNVANPLGLAFSLWFRLEWWNDSLGDGLDKGSGDRGSMYGTPVCSAVGSRCQR